VSNPRVPAGTKAVVQKAKPATFKQFYYLNGSRSAKLMEQRLALVQKAVPVPEETALIESFALRVQLICRQLQLVQQTRREVVFEPFDALALRDCKENAMAVFTDAIGNKYNVEFIIPPADHINKITSAWAALRKQQKQPAPERSPESLDARPGKTEEKVARSQRAKRCAPAITDIGNAASEWASGTALLEVGSAKGRCCGTCRAKPIRPGKKMELARPPKSEVISVRAVWCRVGSGRLTINPHAHIPFRNATLFLFRSSGSTAALPEPARHFSAVNTP
jgi:hypothetical protein